MNAASTYSRDAANLSTTDFSNKVIEGLGHAEVRRQIGRARDEYGPDFDVTPLAAVMLLHRVATAFRAAESYELEAIRLTQTSFNILMVLHRAPDPVTMGDLAAAISVKPPNLTSAVRDLGERGLIRRAPNSRDMRSQLVAISDAGERLLRPFVKLHFEFLATLLRDIEADDRADLIRILDKILTSVTDPSGNRGLDHHVARAAVH